MAILQFVLMKEHWLNSCMDFYLRGRFETGQMSFIHDRSTLTDAADKLNTENNQLIGVVRRYVCNGPLRE